MKRNPNSGVKAHILVSSPPLFRPQTTKMLVRQLLTICRFFCLHKKLLVQAPSPHLGEVFEQWLYCFRAIVRLEHAAHTFSFGYSVISCSHLLQIHHMRPFSLFFLTLHAIWAAGTSPVHSHAICPCSTTHIFTLMRSYTAAYSSYHVSVTATTCIKHITRVTCSAPKYAHTPLRFSEPAHPFSHRK